MKLFYIQATVKLWHSTKKPNAPLIFGYIVSFDDESEDIRVALVYDSDNTKRVQGDGKI